ncbi:MAG: TlpA family protein disulfide reductase [Janthinobacterium lividum]
MPVTWKVTSTAATVAFSVAAVVAVLVVATPVTRNDDADNGLDVTPGLARFAEADRKDAPTIKGAPVSGSGVVSISHPGRVVVVNVWQSTCGPCRGEADALETAARLTKTEATFVGLDVVDQRAAAQAFLRTSASSYPHIFDPDAQQLLKFNGILPVQAIPSTAVIDKKGRIAARIIGPVSTQTLTQLIDEVASST